MTEAIQASSAENTDRRAASMPLAFLVPYKEIPFEGELFKGPANCDGYLKEVYGDYMKLPPENKRGNWHQVIEIKL